MLNCRQTMLAFITNHIALMSHSKRILWFTVLIINIIIVHEIFRKLILTELILLNTNSNYKVNY